MTFPPGAHAMWMRYWLGAGGINPDRDVSLVTIPPPQMVANMKVGKMDGFCVGEPWNARTIADGIGFTAITTQDMWKDHPEKVCAFTAEFADKNPKTVKAVLKALHEASVWLDNMENRPEQAQIVSRATYINCPPEIILGRLQGHYDFGDGRKKEDSRKKLVAYAASLTVTSTPRALRRRRRRCACTSLSRSKWLGPRSRYSTPYLSM
jgi:nitrate/nitrite transport system substrate-binding protein